MLLRKIRVCWVATGKLSSCLIATLQKILAINKCYDCVHIMLKWKLNPGKLLHKNWTYFFILKYPLDVSFRIGMLSCFSIVFVINTLYIHLKILLSMLYSEIMTTESYRVRARSSLDRFFISYLCCGSRNAPFISADGAITTAMKRLFELPSMVFRLKEVSFILESFKRRTRAVP